MFYKQFLLIYFLIVKFSFENVEGNPLRNIDDELLDVSKQRITASETFIDDSHKDFKEEIKQNSDKNLQDDVEILESEFQKENNRLEEQFRGPGIEKNIDSFFAENIEFISLTDETKNQSHFIVGLILILCPLISIGVYIGFMSWRSRLKQRLGMRELLIENENELN